MTTIVFISDTHGRHAELGRLSGDVLVHCGDGTDRTQSSIDELDAWFGEQDFAHVLYVPGNHDFCAEAHWRAGLPVFENAHVVVDQRVDLRGLRIYASPWVPDLQGWAYYASERRLRQAWDQIPDDLDVLITHTPPATILDRNRRGESLGCPDLLRRLARRAPRLHAFGHVHHSGGVETRDGTTFVNASSVHRDDLALRPPVTRTLEPRDDRT
ncbi:MAG: metallophosphoesterase [Myxococcota bacterium]